MEAKFTKRKWLIGVNNTIVDDSAAKNEIATIEIWDQRPWVSNANAHLIAAAPDMYTFIESLQLSVSDDVRRDDLLAKARGE